MLSFGENEYTNYLIVGKAANIVPSRIYPWYLLVNLYVEMGETEKARETARIVLTKEPKVQSTAVREMREKMKEIIQD
ncbi:MAG: hypothetical protein LBL07_02640 [Tannerella sp.]|jgi:hypothetical protein|nr:hypothetical protein [Tannerella sp.]